MITLDERKKIAEWVLNTNDEGLLDKIKVLALSNNTNEVNDFISEYNREIDEAVERVRSGKFTTHEDVEAILY
jgi:hypothetical protein